MWLVSNTKTGAEMTLPNKVFFFPPGSRPSITLLPGPRDWVTWATQRLNIELPFDGEIHRNFYWTLRKK